MTCNSWEEARDLLKKYRDEQLRKSDEVLELWVNYLSDYHYKLGSEEWLVLEQVCIAACDCGHVNIAEDCYYHLKKQFVGSTRVSYLYGLILETQGCYEQAIEFYAELLKKDSTNSMVRKRRVAILRSQNKIDEAIKELNKYLDQCMSDFEAWFELCDLYLIEMDYGKAAFCMEELLLSNPFNHLMHQKYAEIKYTQGDTENIEIAKKYFGQSLKLNPNNTRSLFGFYLCCNYAAQKSGGVKVKKDKNTELSVFAWKNIVNKYAMNISGHSKSEKDKVNHMLTRLFDSMQLS